MFFARIISELERRGEQVMLTTRMSRGYDECVDLLKLLNLSFRTVGVFGGSDLCDKYRASLDRQTQLLELVNQHQVRALVSLCSVDANRVAFGLGIPITNFYDIPLSDHRADFRRALPQARLTIPLSTRVFRPFVVPLDIFCRFSLENDQVYSYPFLDPVIWLKDFRPSREQANQMLRELGADPSRPLVVVREEEYKASYVEARYPELYRALPRIYDKTRANIVIIPRYEADDVKQLFPFAYVLERKGTIQHLLAFADLFIGGGGTINIEA